MLESRQHDPQLAGMWLLGRDIASLASDVTRGNAIAVLTDLRQRDPLAQSMVSRKPGDAGCLRGVEARRCLETFCDDILGRT